MCAPAHNASTCAPRPAPANALYLGGLLAGGDAARGPRSGARRVRLSPGTVRQAPEVFPDPVLPACRAGARQPDGAATRAARKLTALDSLATPRAH